MAISKEKKTGLVQKLKDDLAKSNIVVIVHYRGMSGSELYKLRVELKSKGCNIKIAKNTLSSIAIKGTEVESLGEYLQGPTALLYAQDPVALAKTIADTDKEIESFEVQAGLLDGKIIKLAEISNLAKLGSLEEVRAAFIGKLNGVQSNFVRVVNAPQAGLVALFNAKAQQG